MAEQALYNNDQEPSLPYETLADFVSWLPDYIEGLTGERGRN
jgi:hypothetical protein